MSDPTSSNLMPLVAYNGAGVSPDSEAIARAAAIVESYQKNRHEQLERIADLENALTARHNDITELNLRNMALLTRAEKAERRVLELQAANEDLRIFLAPIFVWGAKHDAPA